MEVPLQRRDGFLLEKCMEKKSFIIYDNWACLMANLPVDKAGELIQAICNYKLTLKAYLLYPELLTTKVHRHKCLQYDSLFTISDTHLYANIKFLKLLRFW